MERNHLNVVALYRVMTIEEESLVRWMLSNGDESAKAFLAQVDLVRVSPQKCPCGCASFDLVIPGRLPAKGGMRVLADFMFGEGEDLNGIFAFERHGNLAGIEVCGYSGDAPRTLPAIESLRRC